VTTPNAQSPSTLATTWFERMGVTTTPAWTMAAMARMSVEKAVQRILYIDLEFGG
jgi:hypothetical protein